MRLAIAIIRGAREDQGIGGISWAQIYRDYLRHVSLHEYNEIQSKRAFYT